RWGEPTSPDFDQRKENRVKEMKIDITCRQLVIGASLVGASLLIASCSSGTGSAAKARNPDARAAAANSAPAQTPTVPVTRVVSQDLNRQARLPGDLHAYQDVAIYPKVPSFVDWIGVDRGSVVKRGQLLVRMIAPELGAQRSEAEAKARGVEA